MHANRRRALCPVAGCADTKRLWCLPVSHVTPATGAFADIVGFGLLTGSVVHIILGGACHAVGQGVACTLGSPNCSLKLTVSRLSTDILWFAATQGAQCASPFRLWQYTVLSMLFSCCSSGRWLKGSTAGHGCLSKASQLQIITAEHVAAASALCGQLACWSVEEGSCGVVALGTEGMLMVRLGSYSLLCQIVVQGET